MAEHMRESSNQQDAGVQSEVAVQVRPSRSSISPKSLRVEECLPRVIHKLMLEKHYLHAMPIAPTVVYSVSAPSIGVVGGIIYTPGAKESHGFLVGGMPGQVGTLARYYLSDVCPPNSESRCLAYSLKLLRTRVPEWKAVVSYADPTFGHAGIIYKATGWRYVGLSHPSAYIILNGKRYHPRSLYSRFGTNDIGMFRRLGFDAERSIEPAKHIYLYPLDSKWAWRMPKALPYPIREATQ